MSKISLIVAMDENGLIGRDNELPWRLPNDLAFFKRTTMGKPIVMGRKTYESIGKPLPGRENVVITRQHAFKAPGCTVVSSIAAACEHCASADEIVIIGGAQLYSQSLELVQCMYVTRVHAALEGDAWFPDMDWTQWRKAHEENMPKDERNEYAHSFEQWMRKS